MKIHFVFKFRWKILIFEEFTLREEIFARINFREFVFGHFAGIYFRELGFNEDFAEINFRELSLTKDFMGINFREFVFGHFAGINGLQVNVLTQAYR